MERVFIKVNENIETHVAAVKETTFTNLTDKTLKTFEKQTGYSKMSIFLAIILKKCGQKRIKTGEK